MDIIGFSFTHYYLNFISPFQLSNGIRTYTDLFIIKLEVSEYCGYGEISLPPYLGHNIKQIEKELFLLQKEIIGIPLDQIIGLSKSKFSKIIQVALDIAFWDLKGNLESTSVSKMIFNTEQDDYQTSFTLTKSDNLKEKLNKYKFPYYKLKLTGKDDIEFLNKYSNLCQKPYIIDPNQGLRDNKNLMELDTYLMKSNCIMIEQPFKNNLIHLNKSLHESTGIPVIADEDFQSISDIEKICEYFQGINIKITKIGGISPVKDIIKKSSINNLKIMIGCMSSSTCISNSISIFSKDADFIDLDAQFLTSNDPFVQNKYEEQFIKAPKGNGLSLKLKENIFK